MKKGRKIAIIIVLIIIAIGVCAWFVAPRFLRKDRGSENRQTRTNTISLSKMDLTDSVSATGTIESASTTTVSADVQGITVKEVLVEVGDTVTKGQKLVTFDKTELKEALSDAKEDYNDTKTEASQNLTEAYQQLSEAQSTYSTQKKQLAATVKKAKKAYEKAKKAAKSTSSSKSAGIDIPSDTNIGDTNLDSGAAGGSGSSGSTGSSSSSEVPTVNISSDMSVSELKEAYEQAKENEKTINAQNLKAIKTAQSQVSKVKTSNEKSLKQAKKSVQEAEETLESASIKATMDGTVTALGVQAGDTYNGSDAVEISDLTQFQVTTTVDEYDITKIEKGQKVVILTDATEDEEIQGSITYVALTTGSSSLSSSSTSSMTGSGGDMMSSSSSSSSGYEVRITLDEVPQAIRSGMTAKCSIIISEVSDVYAVPYDAIHTDSSGNSIIYVLDSSGTQKEIKVTEGMESDYYVEVTSSELSEGLSVVIPSDETSDSSSSSGNSDDSSSAFGGFMGGGPGGGDMGGGPGGGGNMGGGPK